MRLQSRAPHDPRLRGLVRSMWHCRAPGASGTERVLPSGLVQLIVNLDADTCRYAQRVGAALQRTSGTVVQGMQSRAFGLDRLGQRDVLGVVFEPGAARVLLGTPLDALADDHVDLEELVRGETPLRVRMLAASSVGDRFDRLETWLVGRIRGTVDRSVAGALDLMRRGEQRVRVLASTLGTSERGLRRRFHAEVGVSPKTMGRVLRFQRALSGLRGRAAIAEVALDCGYHDQSHLTHEFRELAGVSPSEYRTRNPQHRNHVR